MIISLVGFHGTHVWGQLSLCDPWLLSCALSRPPEDICLASFSPCFPWLSVHTSNPTDSKKLSCAPSVCVQRVLFWNGSWWVPCHHLQFTLCIGCVHNSGHVCLNGLYGPGRREVGFTLWVTVKESNKTESVSMKSHWGSKCIWE